mgnify:CR=1 FL=1
MELLTKQLEREQQAIEQGYNQYMQELARAADPAKGFKTMSSMPPGVLVCLHYSICMQF